jgi:SAM-dependent methyltransferase
LWGWRGVGLDPSPIARVGARELGIDIRAGLLDDDFVPDAPIDVMLMAEVLEHVPEPHAHLALAARHLADDGVLVLTTPDASCVRPETPETTLLAQLSLGHHQFLVDADGLRALLDRAGLRVEVWAVDATLFAVASPTDGGLARVRRDRRATLDQLAQYCATRAETATPGSPLDVGMRMRRVKYLGYAGDFPSAASELPGLRDAILARHGVDLDDPDAIATMADAPKIIVEACYFAGVMARHVDGRPDHAARLFHAAAVSGERQYVRLGRYVDPEVPRFEMQARGEEALIQAERDPDAAPRALEELETAAAAAGLTEIADDYRPRIEALIPDPPAPKNGDEGSRGLRATVRRRLPRRSHD